MLAGVLVMAALAGAAVVFLLDPFDGDDEMRSVPAGAVAVVDDEEISRDEFDHWLRTAAQSNQGAGQESLRDQVMQFLVSSTWIELEATERDISVSDEDVRRQFEEQKSQSFEKERDFQEFLRTSGQTEEDLLYRVRIDILSERIREEVTRGSGKPDQQALDEFVEEFQERYRDVTVCAEGFTTDDCSNGPPLKDDTGTSTTPAPTTPGE